MDKIEFKKPDHYKINYEEYVVPATCGVLRNHEEVYT